MYEQYEKLVHFIVDNRIVGSLSAFTLGFVISTFIKSLVSDILVPLFYKCTYILLIITPLRGSEYLKSFSQLRDLKLDVFFKETVNLFFILTISYFFFIDIINPFIELRPQTSKSTVDAGSLF